MLSALRTSITELPDYQDNQVSLRVRRLQALCEQLGLDALLFVPGLDSKYSPGSHQAVGYVFEGKSNRDAIDATTLPSELEECIVLVAPRRVALYAPDRVLAARLAEPLAGHISNVAVYCPTSAEAADQDRAEELKVASFVQMLRGVTSVGIPCGNGVATGEAASNAPNLTTASVVQPLAQGSAVLMSLERWPLLQAYGLEGVGRGGFFTMNFEIYDVYEALQAQVYGSLDSRALGLEMAAGVATIGQHWGEMLRVLGGRSAPQRCDLSEKQVAEPLAGFFAYGMLRPAPGVPQVVTMPPRVVFGGRTGDDMAASDSITIMQAGCGGLFKAQDQQQAQGALHMVVEAADPRSALRAARTYLLTQGTITQDVFADPDEEQEEGWSHEVATRGWEPAVRPAVQHLLRLYTALVDAAHAAMEHFAGKEGATAHSARDVAAEVLARRAEQLGVAGSSGPLRFALWQCDHANHVQGVAVRGSRQLKVIKLSLADVTGPAPGGGRVALGGLAYADTFLDLPSGALLNLTASIPPLAQPLPCSGPEAQVAARAARSFTAALARAASADVDAYEESAERKAEARLSARRKAGVVATKEARVARRKAAYAGGPSGAADAEDEDEEGEAEFEEDAVENRDAQDGDITALGAAAGGKHPPRHSLGRLLTQGGGDDAVLLTGCSLCPAVSGQLYCFTGGLVLLEGRGGSGSANRAPWVLDFRAALEAISLQRLPLPGVPGGDDMAVVFRGMDAACGLPPACHTTSCKFLALPLAGLSQAARKFLVGTVLPAWQATCREETAVVGSGSDASAAAGASVVTYTKDMANTASPFTRIGTSAARRLELQQAYAVQAANGAATKAWPAIVLPDEEVEGLVAELDAQELNGRLSQLLPEVESLLAASALLDPAGAAATVVTSQREPTGSVGSGTTTSNASSSAGGGGLLGVSLVVGPPGGPHATVTAALAGLVGEASTRVIMLRPGIAMEAGELSQAVQHAAADSSTRHLVIVAACFEDLPSQLSALAAAMSSNGDASAAGAYLTGVVACFSSDSMYQDPARRALLPCVAEVLSPGYVDAIVVAGTDWVAAKALAEEMCPGVSVLRGSRAVLLRSRDELLPPRGAERLARVREGMATRRWVTAAPPSARPLLCGPLQAVRLSFTGALDVQRLRSELSALGLGQQGLVSATSASFIEIPAVGPSKAQHSSMSSASSAAPAAAAAQPLPIPLSEKPPPRPAGCGTLVCVSGWAVLPAATTSTDTQPQRTSLAGTEDAGRTAASAVSANGGVGQYYNGATSNGNVPHGVRPASASGSGAPAAAPSPLSASSAQRVVELSAARSGGGLQVRDWPLPAEVSVTGGPQHSGSSSDPGGELLVIGSGLSTAALTLLVQRCSLGGGAASSTAAAPSTEEQPYKPRTVASLTREEKAAVRAARAFDPLPEGYYYNGTSYFDAFGDSSPNHPDFDRFLAEYVDELNAKMQQHAAEQEAAVNTTMALTDHLKVVTATLLTA